MVRSPHPSRVWLLAVAVAACLVLFGSLGVQSVDRKNFRTCAQTSFCKRLRLGAGDNSLLERAGLQAQFGEWSWDEASKTLSGQLRSSVRPLQDPLVAKLSLLAGGVARFTLDEAEATRLHTRWSVPDVLQEAGLQAFPGPVEFRVLPEDAGLQLRFATPAGVPSVIELRSTPGFLVTQSLAGEEVLRLNSRDLLKLEPYRRRGEPWIEGPPEASKFPAERNEEWEERFGSHTLKNPKGPAGISLDVAFAGAQRVYGIPEHASAFALKPTIPGAGGYSEPYRLFNLDVFEYELDETMALYGSVPLMLGHSAKTGSTSGFFWLNSAETYVDVGAPGGAAIDTQWISETGVLDAFLIPGPDAYAVWRAYADLTGYQALPPKWSIAHHQCRWNYKSQEDSLAVDAAYDEYDIPYDTLWLDIEHTDGKRYWSWDRTHFPQPAELQERLAAHGRHLVTIVDPHMKRDEQWSVHKELLAQGLYTQKPEGGVFEGWCWPGSSSYPDFLLPEVRQFWADRFRYEAYEASTPTLHIWNDMNEPSVFNGPEVTMHKDVRHLRGAVEHRDVHNLYGFYVHMATAQGLIARDSLKGLEVQRPFVLSRAFFAGSQRFGAIWTGDNTADWEHLRAAVPMLLSLNVAGIHFSGADVGGFFGNPEPELMARWYQAAAFQPFFRNHAHIDTKRREPWVFGEPWTTVMRDAIRQRYRYLPYIYTVFWQSHTRGAPIMRPLWAEFPTDAGTLDEENLFLVGSALLVVPVVEPGATAVEARLPGLDGTVWFDLRDGRSYVGGQSYGLPAALEDGLPVLQRGGSFLVTRERARRSAAIHDKVRDPLSFTVALDPGSGRAQGELFQDDGLSFAYSQRGEFSARRLSAEFVAGQGLELRSENLIAQEAGEPAAWSAGVMVERIVVQATQDLTGLSKCALTVGSAAPVQLELHHAQGRLTIRKPAVLADADWSIRCQ